MINQQEFHADVLEMATNPTIQVQKKYYNQVHELAKILAKKSQTKNEEEAIAMLVEYSEKKKLYNRIDPERSAFRYYWQALAGELGVYNRNYAKKDFIVNWSVIYDDSVGRIHPETETEEDMIKKLDFSLEDFEPETDRIEEFFDEIETVVAVKNKKGRPKIRKAGEYAPHWEHLFSYLRHKKTMTEKDLVNLLPENKRKGFKNPSKSVEYYLRAIARREGFQLTISNSGIETMYMLVGE